MTCSGDPRWISRVSVTGHGHARLLTIPRHAKRCHRARIDLAEASRSTDARRLVRSREDLPRPPVAGFPDRILRESS
jgi:hypothetical protein